MQTLYLMRLLPSLMEKMNSQTYREYIKNASPKIVGQTLIKAFNFGWSSAKFGRDNNPYPEGSEEYAQWVAGYRKYMRDANA
jgi:hypothetical protein